MDFAIRQMETSDKDVVLGMIKDFYSSDAISTSGSMELFNSNFENCTNNSPYLKGFIFENNGEIFGYSMLAKTFSTEFGKICIWFEELYLKPEYRGFGVAPRFIDYVRKLNPDAIFKLEVVRKNSHAIKVYEKMGFSKVDYLQMKLV